MCDLWRRAGGILVPCNQLGDGMSDIFGLGEYAKIGRLDNGAYACDDSQAHQHAQPDLHSHIESHFPEKDHRVQGQNEIAESRPTALEVCRSLASESAITSAGQLYIPQSCTGSALVVEHGNGDCVDEQAANSHSPQQNDSSAVLGAVNFLQKGNDGQLTECNCEDG